MSTKYVKLIKSTNFKTWIDDIRNVSGVIRAADMSVATIGAVDYTKALDGLSLKQAQLMLTAQGMNAEKQKTILLQSGLIASSDNISAKLAYQALTTTSLSTAEKQQMMIELGLMDRKTKSLIVTNRCTEAELRAQLTKKGYIGTAQDEIVTSILGTSVREKEAISWNVLWTSIKKATAEMAKWLVTNPFGWATIAIGAVAGLVKGYDALIGRQEKLARTKIEGLNEDISEYDAEISSLEELQTKLESAKGDKTELAKIQTELNKAIGNTPGLLNGESKAWDAANVQIQANIDLLKQQRKEAQQDKVNASKELFDNNTYEADWNFDITGDQMKYVMANYQKYLNAYKEMDKKSIEWAKKIYGDFENAEEYAIKRLNYGGIQISDTTKLYTNISQSELESYWKEQIDVAYDVFEDTINSYDGAGGQNFLKNLISNMVKGGSDLSDISTAVTQVIENEDMQNAINDYWESLVDPNIDSEKALNKVKSIFNGIVAQFPELVGFFDDFYSQVANSGSNAAKSVETSTNKMTVSLEDLEKASDNIKTLDSAFKELSEDGYITTKTLGEIQTATGLSGDEWAEYESKLLNAKAGSAEFNQVLSELTYKILENEFATLDLTNATDEEITAIENKIAATLRENGVTNASAVAHEYVARAKEQERIQTELATVATASEIVALATAAQQVGITGQAFWDLIYNVDFFNNTSIDVSEKIAALQELGYFANWTGQQIASIIGSVKRFDVNGKKGFATYDKDGKLIGVEMYKEPDVPKATIPKFSLPDSSKSKADKAADNARKAKEAAEKFASEKLKNKYDKLELSIKRLTDAIDLLGDTADNLYEDDYAGKLATTTQQLDLATQKSSLLRNEFAQLKTEGYQTSEMANEIAKRMRDAAESIAENERNIAEYRVAISEYYTSALVNSTTVSKDLLDQAVSQYDRNIKALGEGGLNGIEFNLSPTIPENAVEKQREENKALEEEMRDYYETIEKIEKDALELSLKEQKEAYDESLADLKEYNSDVVTEVTNLTDTIKKTNDDLARHTEENPVKINVDTSQISEAQAQMRQLLEDVTHFKPYGSNKSGEGGNVAESANGSKIVSKAKQYLGVKYTWGGNSPMTGWDCSGFVNYILGGEQVTGGRNTDVQWKSSAGTKIDKKNLQPGDVLYFGSNGVSDHVAIYIGDGNMIHAANGKLGTIKQSFENSAYYQSKFMGAKRFASGTPDGNKLAEHIGIMGENYKPEILIDKRTGEMSYHDTPTPFDTRVYDVIGEKETAKLPKFAKGTPTTDKQLLEYVKKASDSTGVPANVLLSVLDQESGSTWVGAVKDGKSYSYGYMQLYDYGVLADLRQRGQGALAEKAKTDPYTNVLVGAQYLKKNYDATGSWQLAAQRYNGSGSAAKKYGEQVWARANTPAFLEAAKKLGDAVTGISEAATNISEIATNTKEVTLPPNTDFNEKLSDFLSSSLPSAENVAKWQDEFFAYLKEQSLDLSPTVEKLTEDFEALNEATENLSKDLAESNKIVHGTIGTEDYFRVREEESKRTAEMINDVLETSSDITLSNLKDEYDRAIMIRDTIYDYYEKRKADGATAEELASILEQANTQTENINDISDKYASQVDANRERLVSENERALAVYDTRDSWIRDRGENLDRELKYDSALEKLETIPEIVKNQNIIIANSKMQQNEAHRTVELLRKNEKYADVFKNYDIEQWFDSEGEFTTQYYRDLEVLQQLNPELRRLSEDVGEIVQSSKKVWYDAEKDIKASIDNTVDKFNEFGNILISTKEYEKESNDVLVEATKSRNTLLQTLRDEEREITKTLQANKHLDEWLGEETRRALFNDEDYAVEMNAINEIRDEAEKLYKDYRSDIKALKEADWWKEEKITAEYNKQLEALNERLDIAKQSLEVAKKQTEYENALKERDTQVYLGNRVVNIADPEKLYNLSLERAEAQINLEDTKTTNAENAEVRNMQRISDELANTIASMGHLFEELANKIGNGNLSFEGALNYLTKKGYLRSEETESITNNTPTEESPFPHLAGNGSYRYSYESNELDKDLPHFSGSGKYRVGKTESITNTPLPRPDGSFTLPDGTVLIPLEDNGILPAIVGAINNFELPQLQVASSLPQLPEVINTKTQDSSVHYSVNIDTVKIDNPVGSASALVTEIASKVSDEWDISKNNRQ